MRCAADNTEILKAVARTESGKWVTKDGCLNLGGGVSGGAGYFTVVIPEGYTGTVSADFCTASNGNERYLYISTSYSDTGSSNASASSAVNGEKTTVTAETLSAGTYYVTPGASLWIYDVKAVLTAEGSADSGQTETGSASDLTALSAGASYSYDFNANQALFGETSVSADGTAIYSESNYLKAEYNSESYGLSFNNGHGLQFAGKLTITALVPANSVGVFTFPLCQYSNTGGTAVLMQGDAQQGSTVCLNAQYNVSDSETESFSYTNDTSSAVELSLVIDGAGSVAYVHNIAYAVNEIPSQAYSVTVNYADNYPLKDASDAELTYIFTNQSDGAAYSYLPSETGSVSLSNGTYTVSLSGDAIDKIPYELSSESATVTVADEPTSITLKLDEVTEWYFGSSNNSGFSGTYNGTAGYYKGLYIDGTSGKLAARDTDAQFNSGTVISVPVNGVSVITVKTYSGYYTVNNAAATDKEFSYIYPGDAGYVDIAATGNDYIYYIKVVSGGSSVTVSGSATGTLPDNAQLVFTNTNDSGQTYYAEVADGGYSLKLPATGTSVDFEITLSDSEYAVEGDNTVTVVENDVTMNVVCYHKVTHSVTLNLGSGPDLSDVTYKFAKSDGTVYTFESGEAISLYDGTYRVTIEGEAYHKEQSYSITSDMELTVDGADTSHTILFEEASTWSFAGTSGSTADYYPLELQKSTGYYNGLVIDASSGKLYARLTSGDTQANSGTVIKIPVKGDCTVTVSAKSASYSPYITVGDVTGTSSSAAVSYAYTGEAGYVTVTFTGTAYLSSITAVYAGDASADVEQSVMPFVPEADTDGTSSDTDNIPRANTPDSLSVDAEGQKLRLIQSGGDFTNASGITYYVFPMTADENVLEFDAEVTSATSKSNCGFFGGVFTNNYQYTIAMRSASTSLRALYSKGADTFSGATGTEYGITLGTRVHYTITTNSGKAVVTAEFTDKDGTEQTNTLSQTMISDGDKVYFGMALASANVTITNMVYKSSDGTVLYSQNDAYYPKGNAPEPESGTSITAATATGTSASATIDVAWTGDVPEYDGTYTLEVQIDGGEWITAVEELTTFSYTYDVEPATTHSYSFRVYGVLGKPSLGGSKSTVTAVTASTITVMGALGAPEVTAEADASGITLTWEKDSNATFYEVYRYSFDEGENSASLIQSVTEASFNDTDIETEMPYYYYVIAKSDNNSSAASETVWAVATAGHTGDYVYESEATEIFITKKSYDTVFNGDATLEGIVYGSGTLKAMVNGDEQGSASLSEGDSFAFELTLEQGRNDVNLLFTDADGDVTRQTYNFVYLTNYDMVVDATFTGNDGDANEDGIPAYTTVQAAVNAVPSDNSDRVVILVMAGDYEERLEVTSPYISIIGQDRDSTVIHCYPGDLGSDYEAGGDMSLRCATYIYSTADSFSAENISFKNDYVYSTSDGKSNKSADALRCDADKAVFVNTKFSSVQDTLYMHSGLQYYYKCRIEGLVDYIYSGEAARCFFNDCELMFVYEATKTSGYVCAPKTASNAAYGLTFYNCVVTAEEGCNGTGYLLARPWGADAYITWIDCYMGKAVYKTLPYSDMSGNSYADARFYEYGTYGPGFEINADRRQISPSKAEAMISSDYLGWTPDSVTAGISAGYYVGSVTTSTADGFVVNTPTDDRYLWSDGDDTGLGAYELEGYAEAYGVSGGGLLKEESENYYKVSSASEFLDALLAVKESGKSSVIELAEDINLGCNEIENFDSYSGIISAYKAQALTHPALIESGVSVLAFSNIYNLTIFSLNGSSIKHANITMKNSENIIIRNIKFDELWEWDEDTEGDYDRNDWDYVTIDQGCNGIWIDHCTFYKAYDGVVDIKNPNPEENVTVSWCEFLPGSEDDVFFNEMMDLMASDPDSYPYYKSLLNSGMTQEQIWWYAYGQKKTHLLGQSDDSTNAVGIMVTLANNYYKNSMDRMPRLRYGTAHVYNCVMDAQELLDAKDSITNSDAAKHIVSNGASSTCGAYILLENCYINGIQNALNSGNGSSPAGYINAINSAYYMYGVAMELEPKSNSTTDTQVLVTDADEFISELPYSDYILYDAEYLDQIVVPYAGAGKLELTVLQWEKTSYNTDYTEPEVETKDTIYKPSVSDTIPDEIMTDEIKNATGCETVDELVVYLKNAVADGSLAQQILSGVDISDTLVIDVTIMISTDGGITWVAATEDNFPEEGIDIILDYPENTDKENFDFVIGHLIVLSCNGMKPGSMEYYTPEKTEAGLKIHIMSASPFVIGWKSIAASDDNSDDSGSSADNGSADDGSTDNDSIDSGSTEEDDGFSAIDISDSRIISPKTYDNSKTPVLPVPDFSQLAENAEAIVGNGVAGAAAITSAEGLPYKALIAGVTAITALILLAYTALRKKEQD
ncbi:MAG: pectinesterase family protein [Lachnospiraceae bacterium]|nr:pectinesterase family protein [Lachnospiraceae bacterium]